MLWRAKNTAKNESAHTCGFLVLRQKVKKCSILCCGKKICIRYRKYHKYPPLVSVFVCVCVCRGRGFVCVCGQKNQYLGTKVTAWSDAASCKTLKIICYFNRAGHFGYFLHFFNNKKWFYCIFHQINNLFLHQSNLKSPLPVKLTW